MHLSSTARTLTWGIPLGMALDASIADPGGAYHPVALFGRWAGWLERHLYRDSRATGVCFVAVAVAPPVAATALVARRFPEATLAAALAASLGGTTLERIAQRVAHDLAHDPDQARQWIPWLCSRDPAVLDAPAMARATVESVAENASDAAVATLFWSVLGAPAVVAHRCVNTLDAMVGYHNARYEHFGWAAANLDDALAYIPARLTAAVHSVVAVLRGSAADLPTAWKQARQHPSPNAGLVEATAAVALNVQLGGTTVYPHGVEQRPVLGAPHASQASISTIKQSITLERMVRSSVALGAFVARSMIWKQRNRKLSKP